MKKSVIVSTYNWPGALSLVLSSLAQQTATNYEVIIADDGSREDTLDLVKRFNRDFPVPLKHVWQEDRGFRASSIRNLAAKASVGEYLLFLDGDCVPCGNWISQHEKLSQKGCAVLGNRVLLSESYTKEIEKSQTAPTNLTLANSLRLQRERKINRILPLLSLPLGAIRTLGSNRWQRLRSCNFSLWRNDFFRVNGFDEVFEGWGFEDSDLAVRLINAGVKMKTGVFATGVFHLFHKEYDRGSRDANYQRLMKRMKSGIIRAEKGLDEEKSPTVNPASGT